MNRREFEQLNVIRNIATLLVADADEGLAEFHSDEAWSQIETIEILRDKGRAIVRAIDILLEKGYE